MKGLAVLVLRYKQPGQREFRVPLNLKIGSIEIPLGLAADHRDALRALHDQSVHQAGRDDFRRRVHDRVFRDLHVFREDRRGNGRRLTRNSINSTSKRGEDLTPETLRVRPGGTSGAWFGTTTRCTT